MSGSNPGGAPDDPDDADSGRSRDRHPRDGDRADADDGQPSGDAESPRTADRSPQRRNSNPDAVTIEDDGVVRWFLKSESGNVVFARDVLSSIAIVAVIGLILFGISGVWPPLVAVESGSMEPNMERGDLIFVVDDDRFVGDDPVDGTGVVTLENGQDNGHEKFGNEGDVIVFRPNGDDSRVPIIHRAHFWVEEDENWVDTRADDEIVGGATCDDVPTCPAPHDGFITKGDANNGYDQIGQRDPIDVVKPEWVTGKASFRVPWLGHVRLMFDELLGGMLAPAPVIDTAPIPLDDATVQAGLTGATGFAGVGAGVAMAAGRRRP
ncbi:S24/S26 family peptidase [Natronolimnohabitans innermongolicus]|uniref:Signal peptidase I-like protein n=1 Tax=Natronolimnohabitans innermongolicus JCM 12255 TaxID=1227499 RepID=L9X060_9EURY|nr:S26 family signal peptidase [Natronolimnohabitans innermongolicus]ELY55007.1 Signal peptidase I-like protein [Natronolimnohabitans innermongolicus JCM 12255]